MNEEVRKGCYSLGALKHLTIPGLLLEASNTTLQEREWNQFLLLRGLGPYAV